LLVLRGNRHGAGMIGIHNNGSAAWIRRFHPSPDAAARLACFPHAGGSASIFFPLSRDLAPRAEVLAMQYLGRQDRRAEPNVPNMGRLADRAAEALAVANDLPLFLFGHSMGATLAYETARRLQAAGRPPRGLFVDGDRGRSTSLAALRSVMSAGVTMTNSGRPLVSTTRCRLRPLS
jgi:pyochelin biosynthetic protein PchC